MTYLILFIIAALIFNIIHVLFIQQAWRESIRLSATKQLLAIKNFSHLSEENREYTEKLKMLLEFISNNNSTITIPWYAKGLFDLEHESKNDSDYNNSIKAPHLTNEVKEVRAKTIHLFHSSMLNNSMMLVFYLLPIAFVLKIFMFIISLLKPSQEENNIIKIYEHNRDRHA